jgi:hypothetical protein
MSRKLTRRQRRAGRVKCQQEARDPFMALPPEEQERCNARDREAAQRVDDWVLVDAAEGRFELRGRLA